MFSNLDALHSYDPFELLRFIYNFFFGGIQGATDWGSKAHASFIAFLNALPFYLINAFAQYAVFSVFLSIGLIVLIVIYVIRKNNIEEKLMSRVLPVGGEVYSKSSESVEENPKWKLVEEHIDSEDPNKWKLAIIESDIVLSELLDVLNLPGEGVGEKLKNVETGDFETIESAWEAHKIRNAIAHQGSDFLLTKREAKRIIGLYKSVFEEFEII